MLHVLPPYSPELNPQENLWDEIREKIFKNYALKSMDEVYSKLRTLHSTSNAIRHSLDPSHRSHTLQSQSDMETV
jgi:transposase